MKNNLSWTIKKNIRNDAMAQGEDIAKIFEFNKLPVDPLFIIKEEPLLYAEGDDFADAFDGRLEYLGPKYLLVYNTKYNRRQGANLHPRVRFTIAHELGHYFLDAHRNLLRKGTTQYSCTTEKFNSAIEIELQADYFATGLLMPSGLVSPFVNRTSEPDLNAIKDIAGKCQVSMTSMMLRWIKLSHFPCGLFSVKLNGEISWGWVSETLFQLKAYRKLSYPKSADFKRFLETNSMTSYSEGTGKGFLGDWLITQYGKLSVEEFYAVMPYTQNVLVFIYAYEDEIMNADSAYG